MVFVWCLWMDTLCFPFIQPIYNPFVLHSSLDTHAFPTIDISIRHPQKKMPFLPTHKSPLYT